MLFPDSFPWDLHRGRRSRSGLKALKHVVQKAFTLPETTRASFGPTVWQFPILPTERTRNQKYSSHTKVITFVNTFFFPLGYRRLFSIGEWGSGCATDIITCSISAYGLQINSDVRWWILKHFYVEEYATIQLSFNCSLTLTWLLLVYPSPMFCSSCAVEGTRIKIIK